MRKKTEVNLIYFLQLEVGCNWFSMHCLIVTFTATSPRQLFVDLVMFSADWKGFEGERGQPDEKTNACRRPERNGGDHEMVLNRPWSTIKWSEVATEQAERWETKFQPDMRAFIELWTLCSKTAKYLKMKIFSESSPMPWGLSPSWASFWLSSASREWRHR